MSLKKQMMIDPEKRKQVNESLLGTNAATTSYYWGMDIGTYPGDDVMQDWWNNSPFHYTGFYLGPAPYHPDKSFMAKRSTLINQGWGLIPIYVGRQADSTSLTYAQGQTDGKDAVTLMAQAGFPNSSGVYLDIEQGGLLDQKFIDYINGWADQIFATSQYWAGIYCSYSQTANQILQYCSHISRWWVFHLTVQAADAGVGTALNPANSGINYAHVWQCTQNCQKKYGTHTLTIDVNTSLSADPSKT